MAFKHGKGAQVLWNAADVSAYLRSAELSVEVAAGDTSTFGNNWTTALPGQASSTASFEGVFDPATQATWRDQLGTDSGVLTYCPSGGTAIGDPSRLMSVTSSTYSESSTVGDVITFGWEAQSESHTAAGQVLHPLGEDTNTTTGAEKDDTGATATGWTAHLHVTAVDGGSWVVKLEDAAISNTYSDVTGGAFTAATGATSQRLTSAAGTTALRRYVRYTATRTGGSAGDGITFHLSYARTTGPI